jgi:Tfp pilus assembly protein PilF
VVDLEKDYPDDERILEMKGTLAWKLKNTKLARESWERVLQLNPNNTAVAQALESLLGE